MTTLQKGQKGQVEQIDGPARVTRRLAEMGLKPGVWIEMLRPGKPCILRVNRTRLSLGPRLQTCIRIADAPAVASGNGRAIVH